MTYAHQTNKQASWKKAVSVFSTVCAVLLTGLAVLLAGVRLIGLTPFAILSGSMEPVYPVGSLIYVRQTDPQQIQPGNDITFVLNKQLTVATHRVIEVNAEHTQFRTQGIANETPDGDPVYYKNVIGCPVFCIPLLGFVSNFVSHAPGLYITISGGAFLLLLMLLPELIMNRKPEKTKTVPPL